MAIDGDGVLIQGEVWYAVGVDRQALAGLMLTPSLAVAEGYF
jgi:hypothetical protein